MIIDFLKNISDYVKELDSSKSITICVVPEFAEIKDWNKLCFESMDVLSTDPYWILFLRDLSFVKEYSEKVINISKKNNKKSQLWLLAFRIPKNKEEEIREAVRIMAKTGVDSIFAWAYRGGLGLIKSDNSQLVWKIIGEAFNEIKE